MHGLLAHSLQVARLVDCAASPHLRGDRSRAATAGALLYDFGKLEAYGVDGGVADLTDPGRLEGEIPLGYYCVRREIGDIAGFPPELARPLLHTSSPTLGGSSTNDTALLDQDARPEHAIV